VTISERIEAARRERRVLARVCRAAWRLDQAERERTWALVSARAEGISIRTLATAVGLSPSRVHQIVADADLDVRNAALGELRAAGWPTPEDPDSDEDADLDGRDHLPTACRTRWTGCDSARASSGSSTGRLPAGGPPAPIRRLARPGRRHRRPGAGGGGHRPHRRRRGRTRPGPAGLDTAAVLPDPRADRRRRLAEPDLEFRAFCARKGLPASSTPQLERAWDAWQAERYRRGETGQRPGYTDNPFRPR
jgi:hypothetical protein